MKTLFTLSNFKSNWQSAFTVSLISIPLLISLAVASGVNPISGIITAILAGAGAALFGGSNFNIIGPTGALSGLIASYALTNGPAAVPALALATGFFILLAYAAHLERYLVFIPSSVIHGFTLGVACIIALGQLNFAFGLEQVPVHDTFFDNLIESVKHLSEFSWAAITVFICFFCLLLLLQKLVPRIPSPILVSSLGIGVGYAVQQGILPFHIVTLGDKFGVLAFEFVRPPYFVLSKQLIVAGAVMALVAIIETMLSAKIADAMTKTKHNTRKEVFGLGIANILAGLAGGMPATAALARTALNIKAGAVNRLSAFLCGIFIAIVSFFLLAYFSYMPMAVIAAILVYVAINMVEREHIVRIYARDTINFLIVLLVAVITVYEDPIIGILVGSVIALLVLVNKMTTSFAHVAVHPRTGANKQMVAQATAEHILVYTFKGKLVYLNSQAHLVRFHTDFAQYHAVILVLDDLYFIDSDGVDALEEIMELIQTRRQTLALVRPNAQIADLLLTSHMYVALSRSGMVFNSLADALKGCEIH